MHSTLRRRLLNRKSSMFVGVVVCGVMVGVTVGWLIGVQIQKYLISQQKREKVEIAERLLIEREWKHPLMIRFKSAYVNIEGPDVFSIVGTTYEYGIEVDDTRVPMERDRWVKCKRERRKWGLESSGQLRAKVIYH